MNEVKVTVTYTCPKCKKKVSGPVNWDYYFDTKEDMKSGELHICSCVSGGIYRVFFECPYCHEEIDIDE